ncbi:PAS domain-containing sensor histidine kinase [Bosea caraganae]|uniref:histidine kinase n=1 Tax=Bosea caraganae TaxID=2763117 RepID=A0A370KY96_9HYPH|nr:PAS domain-containing sensor histidine kinase [Bosea caraganae]RDJ19950.1 PAS domain-containing sensor histidine kinase [Bosea caraganae]RDJ23889.1 PAS domain-containing sensor histidine kinase [Bosea caraganae]
MNKAGPGIAFGDDRYRLLVEAVTDYAIYMLDADGAVSSWNNGARRFKGYEAHEILGQHFSRFYTEEDRRNGLPARALATAAREGRFESEGWRVRKDGTTFWAHVVIDPIYGPGEEIIGYAKITRDMSERRAAEQALRRSEELFKLLVQGVADYAIYMLDPDGTVASWNLGAQRIKGYRPDEIIGCHFSAFYSEEDRAKGEPQRALETARREGKFEKEGWRIRKDGSRFWANIVLDVIPDDAGQIIGFAKITRDMSERREAERALEAAREALFQTQKIESIGQLTGGVAHDFNNLLTAVLGSLELLRKHVSDEPKLTGLVDNAVKGAERGISLTQRMLAFARRQELVPKPVDVPVLVKGMADLLQRSLGPLVAIETQFPLALAAVQADPNQLELALLNLATNARDAMPGGGTITIAAREQPAIAVGSPGLPPGRYLCLSVTDAGEGMDEDTLTRAREPFFTTKGVGKGTGLGLSMVHGMAEQLGGRLVLRSEKGRGTTAAIWLPVAEPVAEALPERVPAMEQAEGQASCLRVLAVDDDALVLMNTAALLEDLGHEVVEAASGKQALEALRQGRPFDLVITDHAMPQMTGAQLFEVIKQEWPSLPVVLATGYAELPGGADPGMLRLPKPFWQSDLSRIIAEATKRARP